MPQVFSTAKGCATDKRRTLKGPSGALWDETLERELFGEEIDKRLHYRNVQHFSKCRENLRSEFLLEKAFIFHESVPAQYILEVLNSSVQSLILEPISKPAVFRSADSDSFRRTTFKTWEEIVENNRVDMELLIEYNFLVHEKGHFEGDGERKCLLRPVNFFLVTLFFCIRFTLCHKADGFFVLHSSSVMFIYA